MDEAVAALHRRLATSPVLMLHATDLPSVTTQVAGAPIEGPWAAHRRGPLIRRVLEAVADDIVAPRLVRSEVTVVFRPLWPALLALGRSAEPWQLHGLSPEARALFARVNEVGSARTEQLRAIGDPRAVGRAVDQLERRLLVVSTHVRDGDGRAARELLSWRRWQQRVGLGQALVPAAEEGRRAIEASVGGWSPHEALLPWRAAALR